MAMTSTITSLTKGSHLFKIIGYSNGKGIGIGKYIQSETFTIGGYDWCLRYYPDGYEKDDNAEFISVFIELLNTPDEVKALFDIRLIDANGNLSANTPEVAKPHLFKGDSDTWGFYHFFVREAFEESEFLNDDVFTLKCNIFVVKAAKETPMLGASLENLTIN